MRIGKRLYSLMMFIVVAFLGGLLAAGLIVPVAGMATATGTGMVESLDNLPTELQTPPQPQRSVLLNADKSVLAYFYDENRIYETLDKIAPIMQQAQVAIEDHRFYEHGALDLTGTLRALVRSSQGNTQGGSSLTQQYVRLVLVEIADENNDATAKAAATENTIARKIRELRYAIALEKQKTKDQILEGYLNIAYYGDGAYGVEAAAKHYFNTSAAKLTLSQAAMLAGLVRNPVATNPVDHPAQAIDRRNTVLDRMAELTDASGAPLITAQQAAEAKAEPFDKKKVRESRLGCANSTFPFICDYALEVLKQQATSLG
ncbi:MAG TPA: biosynthetic peptidoglycan transglycosylase, partial [Propionicimonas sp.]